MGCPTGQAGGSCCPRGATSPGGSCAVVWALVLTCGLTSAPWALLDPQGFPGGRWVEGAWAGDRGSFQAAGMLIASYSAHFEFYIFACLFFFFVIFSFFGQNQLTFLFPSLISIPPCRT